MTFAIHYPRMDGKLHRDSAEQTRVHVQVHNKTMELQKVHAMNRRMNEGFASLELRCRNLQHHNQALMSEVFSLVDHLRDNLGKELDNKRLAGFLRNISQLMPPQQPPHQVASPAPALTMKESAALLAFETSPTHCKQGFRTAKASGRFQTHHWLPRADHMMRHCLFCCHPCMVA